ncbi:unnamed protein product [Echinostoma caproni]|uniref:SCP domain-containing protein n=1 Tax=Echinostoma caproni TaxID=27848 RepID=A0A183A7H2_9TREM|nr:unnamed protein product [Echinostoma caproni]
MLNNRESVFNSLNNDALAAHNRFRAMHGCPPLTLDSALSRSAQKWAEDLALNQCMRHSDQTTYGENLAYMGVTKETFFGGGDASKMWYSQIDFHDYDGEMTYETCYFTQMIWKDTKIVGFGQATSADGCACYIVAHYMPKGNIRGQFHTNVFPPRLDAFAEQYDSMRMSQAATLPAVTPSIPARPETKEERKAREKAEKKERERLEKERKEMEKRTKKELKEREKLEKKEKRKSLKL